DIAERADFVRAANRDAIGRLAPAAQLRHQAFEFSGARLIACANVHDGAKQTIQQEIAAGAISLPVERHIAVQYEVAFQPGPRRPQRLSPSAAAMTSETIARTSSGFVR